MQKSEKTQHLFTYRPICVIRVGPTMIEADKKECPRLQHKLTNFSTTIPSHTAAFSVANTTKPFQQGFMQDNTIASHTYFGGHMDVNC